MSSVLWSNIKSMLNNKIKAEKEEKKNTVFNQDKDLLGKNRHKKSHRQRHNISREREKKE